MMLQILKKVTWKSEECLPEVKNGHSRFPDRRREKFYYVCICYPMLISTCIFIGYVYQRLLKVFIFNFCNLLLVNRKDICRLCKCGGSRENLSSFFVLEIKHINACMKSLTILLELCVL